MVYRKKTNRRDKKTGKKRHTKRRYRGGERLYQEFTPEKSITPFKSVGFNGYPTASIAAYNKSVTSAEQQNAMNKLSGGAGAGADTDTSASVSVVEVPSFPPTGGINLAYSSTGLSGETNLTNLTAGTNALNDRYVYDYIPKVNNVTGGTKRRRRKQMKEIQMKGIHIKKRRQMKKRTMRR